MQQAVGLIPGGAAKIPHPSGPKKTKHKTEAVFNKLNKDFKNGPY